MPRFRSLRIVALVVLLATSLFGCRSNKKKSVVSTQSAGVRAELVRNTGKSFSDRGWQPFDTLSLVVHRLPQVGMTTDCIPTVHTTPAVALDAAAERVAYRCAPGTGWHVFDVPRKHTGKLFSRCAPEAGDALDWSKVPKFEEVRATLLTTCPSVEGSPFDNRFKALLDESRARGGEASAVAFLGATLAVSFPTPVVNGRDAWDDAWTNLSAASHASLAPDLRRAIDPGSNELALRRALTHVDLSDVSLVDPIERAGRRVVGAPPSSDADLAEARSSSLKIIVRYLAQKRSAAAADIACLDASRAAANGLSVVLFREQAAAIAQQKKACNLDGIFERNPCAASLGCCARGFTCGDSSRRACRPEDIDALVKLEVARAPQDPWPNGGGFGYELLVAAAMAQDKSEAAKSFLARAKKAPTCAP